MVGCDMKTKLHPTTVVLIRELRRQGRAGTITVEEAMMMTLDEINYLAAELTGAEIAEITREGDHQ